ncbi:Bacterial type II secretion system protein F domain protein [Pseudooceanicola marinus]|uniref:Bacterial type II secretion system protein F domain protein n=1 Tax=Pseudooceanicola marinus TaxID=396013 RepID=A0A1X6Z0Q1_9RHOB|nr:type II secretion system F family protein [Pseudooceanicola marinus]PJE32488.1 pilus assembly protein TadC [Pseudooceanicola marinus]SLN36985.1 Bacterial type II secretion system protein F domain protein [Pseudooceanicola marinus]
MQDLMQFITDRLGPAGPLYLVGGLGLFLILLTIPFFLKKQDDPLEKLKASNQGGSKDGTDKHREALRAKQANERLERYSTFLEPQNEEEYSAIKLKLLQAGYRSKDAVRYYYFAQFALGILGLLAGTIYFMLFIAQTEPTTQTTLLWILGPGGAGYYLPKYWVNKRLTERKQEIEEGFPDSLDMLLVCVEAGQSIDQAIIRVAEELRASYEHLADEFEMVSWEIKAGKDKAAVFQDMAERCGVNDISSFVTVLIQSATFGTSIADALRVYAAEMRDKRVMRAEEAANKLPTKMTLATMMFCVPPLLIILVGPSIVNIQALGQ